MKFTCAKKDLLQIIQAAEPITGAKSNFTILSNLLFETIDSDSISIKASNMEMTLTSTIPAKVAKSGSITIVQNKLLNVVKQLSDGDILIEASSQAKVSIKSLDKKRNANANLLGVPVSEFPEIPSFPSDKPYISLDKLYFKKMVQKTVFCVSMDNSKYTLNGVFFDCQETHIKMVAIDGRRLAMMDSNYPKHEHEAFNAIIPQAFLSQIQKVLNSEGPLLFQFSDNRIFFKFDHLELSSNVLSGKFPNYKMFVPNSHEYQFRVNTQELINAINLASVLVDSESNKLTCELGENTNTLTIYSQNQDYGDSKEEIFVQYQGPQQKAGLNHKLLAEILKEVETEEIDFFFNNPISPFMLKEKDRDEYFFILMPMKLDA